MLIWRFQPQAPNRRSLSKIPAIRYIQYTYYCCHHSQQKNVIIRLVQNKSREEPDMSSSIVNIKAHLHLLTLMCIITPKHRSTLNTCFIPQNMKHHIGGESLLELLWARVEGAVAVGVTYSCSGWYPLYCTLGCKYWAMELPIHTDTCPVSIAGFKLCPAS